MSTSNAYSKIELSLTVTLTEAEVKAFDALVGYGFEGFLKVFYEHMGSHYMKPNEAGLKLLFDTMGPQCAMAISRINAARKAFDTQNYKVVKKELTP